MSLSDASSAGLESLLNRYLGLDPEARARLEALHGRVIGLEVLGLGLRWYLVPGPAGLQVLSRFEGEPDCTLAGTPLDLARMGSEGESADQLFSGAVKIRGDTELGHSFGKLLAGLDIDWEEQLSRLTGDVLAHAVGNLARGAARWGKDVLAALRQDLPEYLQEEARLLPGRYEVEEFLTEVDRLRDDLERLEQRVQRLAARASDRQVVRGKPQ
jgi:ubiquinone biosynthesis protein UbiJ